jgi:hypothetical protein
MPTSLLQLMETLCTANESIILQTAVEMIFLCDNFNEMRRKAAHHQSITNMLVSGREIIAQEMKKFQMNEKPATAESV